MLTTTNNSVRVRPAERAASVLALLLPLIRPSATFSRVGEKEQVVVTIWPSATFSRVGEKGQGVVIIRPSATFSRVGEKGQDVVICVAGVGTSKARGTLSPLPGPGEVVRDPLAGPGRVRAALGQSASRRFASAWFASRPIFTRNGGCQRGCVAKIIAKTIGPQLACGQRVIGDVVHQIVDLVAVRILCGTDGRVRGTRLRGTWNVDEGVVRWAGGGVHQRVGRIAVEEPLQLVRSCRGNERVQGVRWQIKRGSPIDAGQIKRIGSLAVLRTAG